MIVSFECPCGNTDPQKAKYYDGCLGYEAVVCTVCGNYFDYNGLHIADDWSKQFVHKANLNLKVGV
jgi:hypothetical protein